VLWLGVFAVCVFEGGAFAGRECVVLEAQHVTQNAKYTTVMTIWNPTQSKVKKRKHKQHTVTHTRHNTYLKYLAR
jgi:hypothetical protein